MQEDAPKTDTAGYEIDREGIAVAQYLSRHAAAEYTTFGLRYLDELRATGGGPVFISVGKRILYRRVDLDEWLANHRFRHTAARDAKVREKAATGAAFI